MPLGVQIIKSGLMQLGGELEEASRIAGASWWTTYRRIVLRLMAPTLLAVGMITFVGAARNIGNFALLTTSANRPLSILQLDYIAQRKFEEAVVVACIIMFISLGGALAACPGCAAMSDERDKESRVRLEGKVAMVTGTSPNIGAGIAGGLAEEGAKVVCVDVVRGQRAGSARPGSRGAGGQALGLDLRRDGRGPGGGHGRAARARPTAAIDVLVNNAGILGGLSVLEMPLERWNRQIAVNLTGTFLCTKHVARLDGRARHAGAASS